MAKSEKNPDNLIGFNVRLLRERQGLSQEQLAEKARVSQTTIDKIERGETKRSRFIFEIAKVLGASYDDLVLSGTHRSELGLSNPIRTEFDKLSVFLLLERSKYKDKQLAPTLAAHPLSRTVSVDTVRRPPFIPSSADAYALIITDQTMEPEFEPGDMAYINAELPVIRNTTCVFLSDDVEYGVGVVRRLVDFDRDYWSVQQWSSKGERHSLARGDYWRCHRVVGRHNRR